MFFISNLWGGGDTITDDLINQILDEIGLESINNCETWDWKKKANTEKEDEKSSH